MRCKFVRRVVLPMLCLISFLGAMPSARAEEETVDVLLIGLDRRPGLAGCRSDTVILCSYAPSRGKLTLVSVLRDLYLPVPGHGSDRLNAAYAYGGRELLVDTLEEAFDIGIDGCVEVDFGQFAALVDALGGVPVTLRADEAARLRRDVPGSEAREGERLLTGQEALCYSRIRDLDPDGDQSRTRRQRDILLGILSTWKKTDMSAMLATFRELLGMVSTDLSPLELLDWAFTAAPQRAALRTGSLQIPAPGLCWDETIRGMAVLRCDLGKNRQLLHHELYGD